MAAAGTAVSATARLHSAFSKPLYARCIDIVKILDETSLKELHTVLPLLLENIFGFNNQMGWGIHRLTRAQGQDWHNCHRLLAPDGPLFRVLYKLMQEQYCRYDFPVSCLPCPSRQMLEEGGGIPPLYGEKVQFMPGFGRPYNMLALNAFEYYLFHFSYLLVNPNLARVCHWSNSIGDYLYAVLAEDYMNYFLPLNGHPAVPVSNVASPIRSPISSPFARRTPGQPASSARNQTLHGLFSPNAQGPNANLADHSGDAINCSYTFLQIIVEFWLNQSALTSERSTKTSPVSESFMPSENHVRLVRMLVKHLHYFSNSAKPLPTNTTTYTQQFHSALEEFKRVAFNQIVQKKLYTFLRHGFEKWPLDSSFRTLLETWLSTIQPWRYSDPNKPEEMERFKESERFVSKFWQPFIAENLLFFTVLFHQFLARVFRLDLSAPKNAYMLFRMTRIFSIKNLPEMIAEVEKSLFEPSSHLGRAQPYTSDIGASYLSPSNKAPSLNFQFSELEGPTFKYHQMFSESCINHVHQLIGMLYQVKSEVLAQQGKTNEKKASWWSWLGFGGSPDYNTPSMSFYEYEDYNVTDTRRLIPHIEHSIENLCAIFEIPKPDAEVQQTLCAQPSTRRKSSDADSEPDVISTENGVELSPLGRYQLRNGLRKFDVRYTRDPDLQPVRSYEYILLVRMLYQLAEFFNVRYCDQIEELYNRDDFVGSMAYHYFRPADNVPSSSPITKSQRQFISRPRISFRWMARQQNVFCILFFFMFCYFWKGYNVAVIILISAFLVLLYGVVMAVIFPKHKFKRS